MKPNCRYQQNQISILSDLQNEPNRRYQQTKLKPIQTHFFFVKIETEPKLKNPFSLIAIRNMVSYETSVNGVT